MTTIIPSKILVHLTCDVGQCISLLVANTTTLPLNFQYGHDALWSGAIS
jgi:hypothetical protein